ncbi:MAG: DPP IV N-terminal domain-containing protein [Candidatus Acidiferrales bacterium]
MPRVSRAFSWSALFIAIGIGFLASQATAQTATAAAKNLTVERIYSAPSLSGHLTQGIEWAPDSKRISYLTRNGGGPDAAVELWTMDAATGERKVLVGAATLARVMQPEKQATTQATGLGRVAAENYIWAPDGKEILFAGSSELVLLDLATMKPKVLVTGNEDADIEDPKFSPDGRWVSYVAGANLWVVNIVSNDAKALTTGGSEEILKGKLDWVYPEELSASTAYWWSPDSTKLAYYEMDERPVTRYPIMDMSSVTGAMQYTRFPQAGEPNPIVHVGVVGVTGGETKWMDTGSNTDVYLARVNWLPDSRQVAIQRINRAQDKLELLFADAASGASRTILTEADKYWINLSDDLYFFADGRRFLWSSERTGFRHYYVYDLSGKELAQVTSGDWGINGTGAFGPGTSSHPQVDEAHDCIYFISNKDKVVETQVYRVSMRDKSVTRITRDAGTHQPTFAPDSSGFVDAFSTLRTPPRRDLDRIDGKRVAAIDENKVAELAEYHLSPAEFVNVSADDGTKLYGVMIKPPNFDPSRKYPVLVNVYGGPQAQNVRDLWGDVEALWLDLMSEKGYIIFTLDNRGSYNRGHVFETPLYHRLGKVELEDQVSGVKYLKSLPYVDGSRVGIWGWSYGGFMTLNAMFNAADVFKAGVAVAPVSDWRLYDTIYTERYMGLPKDNPEGYKQASPGNDSAKLKGQLLLAHGTGDDNVHFANTSEVLNQMIENGTYPSALMIFPGRGHPIGDRAARIQLFERITEFFLKNL